MAKSAKFLRYIKVYLLSRNLQGGSVPPAQNTSLAAGTEQCGFAKHGKPLFSRGFKITLLVLLVVTGFLIKVALTPYKFPISSVSMLVIIGESETPVVGLYVNTGWMWERSIDSSGSSIWLPVGRERVIIAVWADGRVVWSKDQLWGGEPYFVGKIPRERIDSFLEQLRRLHVFKDPLRSSDYIYTPDFRFTTIAIFTGSEMAEMCSEHEFWELSRRKQMLAEESRDFRRFCKVWAEIREAAKDLIPSEGQPAGDLQFEIRRVGGK
jgi:hypothetical protein